MDRSGPFRGHNPMTQILNRLLEADRKEAIRVAEHAAQKANSEGVTPPADSAPAAKKSAVEEAP